MASGSGDGRHSSSEGSRSSEKADNRSLQEVLIIPEKYVNDHIGEDFKLLEEMLKEGNGEINYLDDSTGRHIRLSGSQSCMRKVNKAIRRIIRGKSANRSPDEDSRIPQEQPSPLPEEASSSEIFRDDGEPEADPTNVSPQESVLENAESPSSELPPHAPGGDASGHYLEDGEAQLARELADLRENDISRIVILPELAMKYILEPTGVNMRCIAKENACRMEMVFPPPGMQVPRNDGVLKIIGDRVGVEGAEKIIYRILELTGRFFEDTDCEYIKIPVEKIGILVIKLGENMRDVQRKADVRLSIRKFTRKSLLEVEYLKICGEKSNILRAIILLQELLCDQLEWPLSRIYYYCNKWRIEVPPTCNYSPHTRLPIIMPPILTSQPFTTGMHAYPHYNRTTSSDIRMLFYPPFAYPRAGNPRTPVVRSRVTPRHVPIPTHSSSP